MKTDIDIWSHLAQYVLEWEMFQIKFEEKIKTHILCSTTVFRKSCRLWDNVEKLNRVGLATDDNIAHALCMQEYKGYKHTHRISDTYCFGTATMLPRIRLNVSLHYIAWLLITVLSDVMLCRLIGRLSELPTKVLCSSTVDTCQITRTRNTEKHTEFHTPTNALLYIIKY